MTRDNEGCVPRMAWELPFLADAQEVAGLRRMLRLHMTLWGLPHLVDEAQICVSELVANVITHVGPETPTTLTVSMRDTYVRLEIRDPDSRALPTLLRPEWEAESGRGMALVDAIVDKWGVILREDHKVVWCELATALTAADGHVGGPQVTRTEGYLSLYDAGKHPLSRSGSKLVVARAEEAAIDLIADVLHWLRAHGCDPEEVLDRAQVHFDAELEGSV